MVFVPDFFDRDGDRLRCRPCRHVFIATPVELSRVGTVMPCPLCLIGSRIPTAEESEWPNRKDADDPAAGVSPVER